MDHIKDILSEFLKKTNLLNRYSISTGADFFNSVLKEKNQLLKECFAYRFLDGILFIECKSSFMQEVSMLKSYIIREVNHFLKKSEVRDLRFKIK